MPEDKKTRILDMLARAEGVTDSAERSRKYRNIVGILSMEAARSDDPWFLEEAIKTAGLVTDDPSKAHVDIIRAMAKIGVNGNDEKTLNDAVGIANRIDNDLDISVALHELAAAFAKTGINIKDDTLFSYSIELAGKIPLNTYHSSALRNIARLLAGSSPGKALELLEKAIELIEKCRDAKPVYLVPAFCDIASLLSMLDDKRSYGFIRRAITLADGIEDDFGCSTALLNIVETESAIGTRLKDERLLNEAIAISKGITKEYYKTLALDAVKNLRC